MSRNTACGISPRGISHARARMMSRFPRESNSPVTSQPQCAGAKRHPRPRMPPLVILLQFFHGYLMPTSSGLFPRHFNRNFPVASRGEGCWIIADDGRRFLDASGQAAVVNIGHGVTEIGRAMAEQSSQIAFAHTSQFHNAPAEKLAARPLAMAPPNFRNA